MKEMFISCRIEHHYIRFLRGGLQEGIEKHHRFVRTTFPFGNKCSLGDGHGDDKQVKQNLFYRYVSGSFRS
jgi:hypothetical protein